MPTCFLAYEWVFSVFSEGVQVDALFFAGPIHDINVSYVYVYFPRRRRK